eukprot:TRINITY_DN31709_c0_g2_i1.p2 TRINITY_DN31709_c0_g2~~TRINITY_DN31709_c0_g2_i1.p2  ORF type:complete len:109 (+),score=5.53 TRINITY_DN31709_c0_g2_i1:195-521(+)
MTSSMRRSVSGLRFMRRKRSPIALAHDEVERAENGHHVGDQIADAELGEDGEIAERGGAEAVPGRRWGDVRSAAETARTHSGARPAFRTAEWNARGRAPGNWDSCFFY